MEFFYFLKIIFNISTINSTLKQPENIKKKIILNKKNLKFLITWCKLI